MQTFLNIIQTVKQTSGIISNTRIYLNMNIVQNVQHKNNFEYSKHVHYLNIVERLFILKHIKSVLLFKQIKTIQYV